MHWQREDVGTSKQTGVCSIVNLDLGHITQGSHMHLPLKLQAFPMFSQQSTHFSSSGAPGLPLFEVRVLQELLIF